MLNGSTLNGSALNGSSARRAPAEAVRGQAYTWRLRLLVGGDDLTAQLTGSVDIDREEGAAGVAGFALYLPPGEPVVPTDWVGRSVSIDYISRNRAGIVTESRRYTGRLELPAWDPINRLLRCECSDGLQQRVEGMSVEAIDALVGGVWSADLFEPADGRSRWDYALERLESRPASLDCSPAGALRVTSWYAQPVPHFIFGAGTVIDGSLQIELQPLGSMTNCVEIEVGYRYPRLWQYNQSWSWEHPEYGSDGLPGFCLWRVWATELPTTDMIEGAVSGAGMQLVGGIDGYRLPLTMANPCGDGNPWINSFDNLWLSVEVTGARRWVQTVTEQYTLTVTAPGGEAEATRIIARDSASIEIDSQRADDWPDSTPGGSPGAQDLSDEGRRQAALSCLLQGAATTLIAAHRGTTVSWQTPTDLALGVDLTHTLRLDDSVRARGKCRRIVDAFDVAAGTAITTLSVAVMRGGGASDPLAVPDAPATGLASLSPGDSVLPTQLGGRLNHPITGEPIPPYDEELAGFSGNWDANDDPVADEFPREFVLDAVEIPAEYTDERIGETAAAYAVGIPNDLLEL
jgi:hypothetical protein